jgi:small subunit ribosomal protein S11
MAKDTTVVAEEEVGASVDPLLEKVALPESEKEVVTSSKNKKANKKRLVFKGQAHIQCTYNNTMISVTDLGGSVLGWASSGLLGFKGAKKSTPYAATQVVSDVVEKIRKFQMKELEVFVKGVGSGREAAIRAFSNNGFTLLSIKDLTPIPHNGCRPKRPRRV